MRLKNEPILAFYNLHIRKPIILISFSVL